MKWSKKEVEFLRKNQHLSRKELAETLSSMRGTRISDSAVRRQEQRLNLPPRGFQLEGSQHNRIGLDERMAFEQQLARKDKVISDYKAKEELYIGQLEQMRHELDAAFLLQKTPQTHKITPRTKTGGEATIVALLSDWHLEEEVIPEHVNGMNRYTLEIAKKRADHFFSTLLYLVQIQQKQTEIPTLVLALLGDFITNANLHPESASLCRLDPTKAVVYAQELLISGIDFLLEKSKLNLVIVCHSGNHGRITEDRRHATDSGQNLEWLLYRGVGTRYIGNRRVTFLNSESYHSYHTIYDLTLRFSHGHNMKYGGGIGGITIPVNKAIAQWNTLKQADIDCFGDKHTAFDGMNFVANGSMIGYNAYALSVKAPFQEPMQMVFGIHSKVGRYITMPVKFRGI